MDLSIVIVSWNVKDRLEECLRSVFACRENINLEVFVVDNVSSDGSAQMVKEKFPGVILIANEKNLGFGRANNIAIQRSRGNYVLLLNPDMKIMPGALSGMIKFMNENLDVGVAGCRLIDEKGEIVPQIRRFPGVWDQAALILKLPHLFPSILNRYLAKDFDYNKKEWSAVDSIRGSFFFIRREMLSKLGGFDERFFCWFEEVDYCRRVINAGWKVAYNSTITVVDYIGQSFKKHNLVWRQKQFTKSMVQYFRKWEPWYEWMIIAALRPVGIALAWMNNKLINSVKYDD